MFLVACLHAIFCVCLLGLSIFDVVYDKLCSLRDTRS